MGRGKYGRYQVLKRLWGAAFCWSSLEGVGGTVGGCCCQHFLWFVPLCIQHFLTPGADHPGCLLFWRTKRKGKTEGWIAFLGGFFPGINTEELCAKGERS